jgi:Peptidase A4 family
MAEPPAIFFYNFERTFEVTKRNYIALRFPPNTGAIGFEVSPPGNFKFHEGIVHLPLNTLGFLQAENPGTATITVKGFAPPAAPVQFISSNNSWSGYIVPGGPFASVVGSWTVSVVYSDAGQYSATWVGIDGTTSTPLIQTGIEQTYSSGFLGLFGGGPSYFAWYEVVPAGPLQSRSRYCRETKSRHSSCSEAKACRLPEYPPTGTS